MTPPAYRRGDAGPAVAEIRDRLGRLGLLTSPPAAADPAAALFDDDVDESVRAFQQLRGLTVDGVVGVQTFRRLEEARWALGDRVLSYSAGHLVAGDDVLALQQRLSGLGFDLGRVDGVFGVRTDAALREFQRSVGVDADGTCGPDTFRAIARLGRPADDHPARCGVAQLLDGNLQLHGDDGARGEGAHLHQQTAQGRGAGAPGLIRARLVL